MENDRRTVTLFHRQSTINVNDRLMYNHVFSTRRMVTRSTDQSLTRSVFRYGSVRQLVGLPVNATLAVGKKS